MGFGGRRAILELQGNSIENKQEPLKRKRCLGKNMPKAERKLSMPTVVEVNPSPSEGVQEKKNSNVLSVPAAENVLRLMPPLTVSFSEIDIALKALSNIAKEKG